MRFEHVIKQSEIIETSADNEHNGNDRLGTLVETKTHPTHFTYKSTIVHTVRHQLMMRLATYHEILIKRPPLPL